MLPSAPALLLTALGLLLQGSDVLGCKDVALLSQQLDTMLAEHDREVPPPVPVLTVTITFDLRHAALQSDSTVHVLGDLTVAWTDKRLTWNESEWGCDSVIASSERLWTPDVTLLNSAGGGAEAALNAKLSSEGAVSWVIRYDVLVPIALDLTRWPADTQTTVLSFGSVEDKYEYFKEDLAVTPVEQVVLFEAGEWEVMSVSGEKLKRGGRWVGVFKASMRRRASAHAAAAAAIIAATVLILISATMMAPLARPPLCACASFTASLWLVSALLRLPSSSTTPVPLAVVCALCVAGGAAAAAAALVARVARCSSQPPRLLKTLAYSLSVLCRLSPLEETSGRASTGAWAALATLLDYALLAVLLLTLFIAVCVYL